MKSKILALLFPLFALSQGYTSYFTGSATDRVVATDFGVCLMGGATEHDNAMRWLLQKANGGDVVVLRSSGSNGYNDYLYTQLGVTVNSVETLVITSVAGATNPYVLNKVAKAEMIWFAGGDQWDYISYFKNNALEDLINQHINTKHAPIGGTSAGMAILGGKYFSAQNGSVTSAEALANPYNSLVTLGNDDFLQVPYLDNVITDTHYDNPDRRGRQAVFLARFKNDLSINVNGIACNEYVAVCIDNMGKARVFGDYPNYQEFAYFIQGNCTNSTNVNTCQLNTPLTWNFPQGALKVYKVPGTMTGINYFNLDNWQNAIGSGGSFENWSINSGVLVANPGAAPDCTLTTNEFEENGIQILPNPFTDSFTVNGIESGILNIYDSQGRVVLATHFSNTSNINTTALSKGLYSIKIESQGKMTLRKALKR